ncbi:hypothetical protein TKK_0003182 [Trichogramma kaykai]|uniref:Uncharacterized protein n=1 Tax=Trichogramma kaykai TaxID=54128 RepID=A0ABD2WT59_9HYME
MGNKSKMSVCTFAYYVKAQRDLIKWEIEEHRVKFLHYVDWAIKNCVDPTGFNLLYMFRREEIDYAMDKAALSRRDDVYYSMGRRFVKFANLCNYKDKPHCHYEIDDSQPNNEEPHLVARGTTALHHASRNPECDKRLVRSLFRIYGRRDVHYVDLFGSTHFQVACQFGLDDVVEAYLKLGRDPDEVARVTGDRPLSLAWGYNRPKVARTLQLHGADLNLAAERTKERAMNEQEAGPSFVHQELTAEEEYKLDF